MNKVAIIGQGYVGLSLSLEAHKSHKVFGFDIDESKIAKINKGLSPLFEVASEDIRNMLSTGNYEGTTDPTAIAKCEIVVIAVPTPLDSEKNPDLSLLISACEMVRLYISEGTLVINESTSFPGTLRDVIKPIIKKSGKKDLHFAASPERVNPGSKKFTQANTPRLYSGLSKEAFKLARSFYSDFCGELVEVRTPEIAESAKLFENSFRQINIAFVNEFARIMQTLNIPVREVLDAANTKPFGIMRFDPGIGVGGHCIPVDPSYLAYVAKKAGLYPKFIELANQVNSDMPNYVISRLKAEFGDLANLSIQVVGIAYKPDVSDYRESPSIRLIEALRSQGIITNWCDPIVEKWNGEFSENLGEGDILVFTVAHESLIKPTKNLLNTKKIFDVTGKLNHSIGL